MPANIDMSAIQEALADREGGGMPVGGQMSSPGGTLPTGGPNTPSVAPAVPPIEASMGGIGATGGQTGAKNPALSTINTLTKTASFSQDPEIKELARQLVNKLMGQI